MKTCSCIHLHVHACNVDVSPLLPSPPPPSPPPPLSPSLPPSLPPSTVNAIPLQVHSPVQSPPPEVGVVTGLTSSAGHSVLPCRHHQREDPVFRRDLEEVFEVTFKKLMAIPEGQLHGIHKVQVGRACCYGKLLAVLTFIPTESGVGVFPCHPTRAGTDILMWRDCVRSFFAMSE